MSRSKITTEGQKNLSCGRNSGCILQPQLKKDSPSVNILSLQCDCLSTVLWLNFICQNFNTTTKRLSRGCSLTTPSSHSHRLLHKQPEEQALVFSTVICNIVSVNVFCGYGCNCPEKTANNCSNKMEHIRITAGCPTASLPASLPPPVIMQFHKELNYCLSSTKQSLHI